VLDGGRLRAAEEMTMAERQLLELMLANDYVRRAMLSTLQEEEYAELATGAIFSAIVAAHQAGLDPDFATLSERIETETEKELLPALLMSDLAWAGGDDFDTLLKKATEALSSLRRRQLERKLDTIQMEIGQAEREHDEARVLSLFQQKTEVQKRKLALSATSSES
jgi:replicative DNA helicase